MIAVNEVLEAYFNTYYGYAYCFALKLSGDCHMAEDLAQEAFYRITRKMNAGIRIEHPTSYIMTTVMRENITRLRKKRRSEEALKKLPIKSEYDFEVELTNSELRRLREKLETVLETETLENTKTALEYLLTDSTYEKLARKKGIRVEQIRGRIYRGKKKIRSMVAEYKEFL